MLCKKCEPVQKTASKSVDANRRHSLACVKKINSVKIHQGCCLVLAPRNCSCYEHWFRGRFFHSATVFEIIFDWVYVSAYQSNRLFMKNMKIIVPCRQRHSQSLQPLVNCFLNNSSNSLWITTTIMEGPLDLSSSNFVKTFNQLADTRRMHYRHPPAPATVRQLLHPSPCICNFKQS